MTDIITKGTIATKANKTELKTIFLPMVIRFFVIFGVLSHQANESHRDTSDRIRGRSLSGLAVDSLSYRHLFFVYGL